MCGEQLLAAPQSARPVGSPPRVRGTGGGGGAGDLGGRITPACAGNSKIHFMIANFHKDHPRVCGEQYSDKNGETNGGGSPPRVRGTAVLRENLGR